MPKVLTVHTNFTINRNPHDAHTGEVTHAERVKAAERFLRWHERQVIVGRDLLAKALAAANADEVKSQLDKAAPTE